MHLTELEEVLHICKNEILHGGIKLVNVIYADISVIFSALKSA